jgi:hypothetical protein
MCTDSDAAAKHCSCALTQRVPTDGNQCSTSLSGLAAAVDTWPDEPNAFIATFGNENKVLLQHNESR